jgi:hypothetical protein
VRQLEQTAAHLRVGAEQSGEQRAVAAADVHGRADVAEVAERGHDRRRSARAAAGHPGVEARRRLRVAGEMVEKAGAEHRLEGGTASGNAVLERTPGAPVLRLAEPGNEVAQRSVHIAAQHLAHRREAVAALRVRREYAEAGECAH